MSQYKPIIRKSWWNSKEIKPEGVLQEQKVFRKIEKKVCRSRRKPVIPSILENTRMDNTHAQFEVGIGVPDVEPQSDVAHS
jgi:hypothetical protein